MKRFILVTIVTGLFVSTVLGPQASAASLDWQAGNIISDSTFTNSNSMSAALIQQFLESKVPSCDTAGLGNSEFGGPDLNSDGKVQRWEYGKAYYNQTSFPCLRDYRVDDGRLASQVIYDTAQKYSINPQVILVLLQKEQGLVTDTWPLSIQYRSAAGYGCPDTAACDSKYYGLINQVDWAAKMYRAILNDSPTWYTPYILGSNFISYNPNRDACGGSTINISNRSTQALYNYTPYQPNQGALDAGWGTAYCGSYGNLRFYQYFTSWFGSTRGGDSFSYDLVMNSPINISPSNPRAGDPITVSFDIKNISGNSLNYGSNLLQCRAGLSVNCDSPTQPGGQIPSGSTRTFSYTITPPSAGTVTIKPFYLNDSGVWYRFGPSNLSTSEKSFSIPQLRATGALSYSIQHPNVGETIKFSVPIINNGTSPLTISTSLIQCRIDGVTNCDTPPGGTDTIPPGSTRTYDYSIPINQSGNYTFTPYYFYNGAWYRYIYLDTPLTLVATDITTNNSLTVSDMNPVPNQPLSSTYSLINNSSVPVTLDSSITQCRLNGVSNCDSPYRTTVSLTAGGSTVVSDNFGPLSLGSYRIVPYYSIGGEYHIPRATPPVGIEVKPYTADMRILDFTVNSPDVGNPLSVTYNVKNYGSKTAYYQDGVLQCRLGSLTNCDSGYSGALTIASGDTKTFTHTLSTYSMSGLYSLVPYFMQNGKWNTYKNSDGTDFTKKEVTVTYVQPNISITSPITLSNPSPAVGGSVTAQYTVKNNGSAAVNIAKWITQCRVTNSNQNCDSPNESLSTSFTLNSGQSITLQSTHAVSSLGTYRLVPYFFYDSGWYTYANSNQITFTSH